MKRKAMFLTALLLLGGIQARVGAAGPATPSVVVGTVPAPAAVAVATAPAVCCATTSYMECDCPECPPSKFQHFRDSAGHFWAWLTWRPHSCNDPHCCCKRCACNCGSVYNFFYCHCLPSEHLPFPPYIGQGQPPRPHCCTCCDTDCGCH
jgi:hypothetical protein